MIKRAIEHSMAFGPHRDGRQVGFALAVPDHATFTYVAEVFVVTSEHGRYSLHGWSIPSWRVPTWGAYAVAFGDAGCPGARSPAWIQPSRPAIPFFERKRSRSIEREHQGMARGGALLRPRACRL